MLIHSVYFYLRPELTEAERADFKQGAEKLKAVASASGLYVGTPAPVAERPVIDRTYGAALVAVFKDVDAHNAYQVDPLHKAFVEKYRSFWTRIQVYDAQE